MRDWVNDLSYARMYARTQTGKEIRISSLEIALMAEYLIGIDNERSNQDDGDSDRCLCVFGDFICDRPGHGGV